MGLGCILSGEKERGISDHSSTLISVARFVSYGPKPFKFFLTSGLITTISWIGSKILGDLILKGTLCSDFMPNLK
jgi:hypothetical protein